MDNFNNNGVPNTPNPLNDNNNTPSNDYNSMQPQSNTVVDESVQPNLGTPQAPVVEEQPAIQQNPSTIPNEQGVAMEELVQSMETSTPDVTPQPAVEIPIQQEEVVAPIESTTAPVMDSTSEEFETTPIMETPYGRSFRREYA